MESLNTVVKEFKGNLQEMQHLLVEAWVRKLGFDPNASPALMDAVTRHIRLQGEGRLYRMEEIPPEQLGAGLWDPFSTGVSIRFVLSDKAKNGGIVV
jgi:hypothetical protein